MIVPPGSTIGIVGGGQLGRMLAIAAAQLGYRSHVYAPEASGPASEVAAEWTCGRYDDADALAAFAAAVDVVTYEFENIDPQAIARAAGHATVRPGAASLEVAQYRPYEKQLVLDLGGGVAPFRPVASLADLEGALADIGTPAILKTAALGYDGKGQARIDSPADAAAAWATLAPARDALARLIGDAAPMIVERRIDFLAEFSVILCRGADGEMVVWDTPENIHRDGILDISALPASAEIRAQAPAAIALSRAVADRLDHVGVLTCEFFATADGPLFNEMAPRVHNSGHWTIEGAVTSQFQNHIRAVCGLPLGDTALAAARVEMRNLIGHEADGWAEILADARAHLHLYGKREARRGRKMGHVTHLFAA
ncbi:MAG: phosphoribosylaminoimidazole carboxylase [Sphingomonas bacterium]|nr:phosphoribosylaminoimidazole carboxylase [Sphingomonas bacterium]